MFYQFNYLIILMKNILIYYTKRTEISLQYKLTFWANRKISRDDLGYIDVLALFNFFPFLMGLADQNWLWRDKKIFQALHATYWSSPTPVPNHLLFLYDKVIDTMKTHFIHNYRILNKGKSLVNVDYPGVKWQWCELVLDGLSPGTPTPTEPDPEPQ